MAGQMAAAQRTEDQHAHAEPPQSGDDLQLGLTGNQVVTALVADEAHHAPFLGLILGGAQIGGGEGGGSDIVGLALELGYLEGGPQLTPGHAAVRPVHHEDLQMVGLQPAEGVVQVTTDLPSGQAGLVVGAVSLAHGRVELGDEDDLLPAAAALGEPLADDLLAGAAAIDIGGVEEGNALLNGLVHDAEAFLLVAQSAKGHGAQADAADVQTGLTNLVVDHCTSLSL